MNSYGTLNGGFPMMGYAAPQVGSQQPGVSAAGSYSVGAQGQAVVLLALIGGLVLWYVATRSIQGAR